MVNGGMAGGGESGQALTCGRWPGEGRVTELADDRARAPVGGKSGEKDRRSGAP